MSVTSTVLKQLGRRYDQVTSTVARATMAVPETVVKASMMKSPAGKQVGNFYTGHMFSPAGNWAWGMGGIGLGIAGGIGSYRMTNDYGIGSAAKQRQMGSIAYSGNISSYAYDGAGNINSATGKYDLGATGDLVLAMSANRRGR